MQDTWLTRYADCEQLGHEIMELINERNRLARSGAVNAKITASIRVKLQTFSSNIKLLKDDLLRAASTSQLLERELQRRQYQLDQLITKEKQLNQAFKPDGKRTDDTRAGLFNEGFEGARSSQAGQRDMFEDFSPQNVRQQQQQIIEHQDKGLDELYKVIQVQKRMGQDIGDEVDNQNELIDDIMVRTDNTNRRLAKESHHVQRVNKKSSTCALLVIIVLLLIAIIVVGVVPT